MKVSNVLAGAAALGAALAYQTSVPAPLSSHAAGLKAAQSLTAKVTATPVGGAPSTFTLTFSKPNYFRIESESSTITFDGKTLTTFDAAKKTYRTQPANPGTLKQSLSAPAYWGWMSFFLEDALADVASAAKGKSRSLQGNSVTEVQLKLKSEPSWAVTLFLDDKLGVARGLTIAAGGKESIIMARELTLGKTALPESTFAFVPPAGATEEKDAAPTTVKYASVQAIFNQNCMPCHGERNRRAGYDLSSYGAVMASKGAVNVENPDNSFIIRSLRADRAQQMPKNKAPLSKDQIQLIYDWMKAGAKND